MLSVSNVVWSSDLGFPGVLLAPCPEDVSLVLSVMTNTAQFESEEEREAEREERCGHGQESSSELQGGCSMQDLIEASRCSCSLLLLPSLGFVP